ncbi:MAG: Tm-1-like ATP-binding domain-containing protein [Mycetocola sp.]
MGAHDKPQVVLIGTLDTKGDEYAWTAAQLLTAGADVTVVDTGVREHHWSTPLGATLVPASAVAVAGGGSLGQLRDGADRGHAMAVMGEGAAEILRRLRESHGVDGVLGLGGSGGTAVAARAVRDLPIGVPKLLVSTMASGDVSPYVGASDVTLMYSVVDIVGINRISRAVLGNAIAAITAMAGAHARRARGGGQESSSGQGPEPQSGGVTDRPLIAASMFGVTTAGVDVAVERLTELGYEVLVFHATGSGGRAIEALARSGALAGVLDLTTTELVDDQLGGVLSAGPDRLEAAGAAGIPQLVSLGALDMANFGPRDTVPERYASRLLYEHNSTVTLMRTSAEEAAQLGRTVAAKLRAARGPVQVHIPRGGISAIAAPGGLFADAVADERLFSAVIDGLAGGRVSVVDSELAINDPAFATAAADALHAMITDHAAHADQASRTAPTSRASSTSRTAPTSRTPRTERTAS